MKTIFKRNIIFLLIGLGILSVTINFNTNSNLFVFEELCLENELEEESIDSEFTSANKNIKKHKSLDGGNAIATTIEIPIQKKRTFYEQLNSITTFFESNQKTPFYILYCCLMIDFQS